MTNRIKMQWVACLVLAVLAGATATKSFAKTPDGAEPAKSEATPCWINDGNGAPWTARTDHATVVFNSKIWILGGNNKNDVWWSSDGTVWKLATANAGWSGRSDHAAVVFDNKIWVLGGSGNNDVWWSEDGATWTCATANAGWSGRSGHTAAVFQDKIWILGGTTGKTYLNDVWCSEDGAAWTPVTSDAAWNPRGSHTTVVFQNKLWVLGGKQDSAIGWPYLNDVWWSEDGATWTIATMSASWSMRHGHATTVFNDKIYLLGGYGGNYENDVWYSYDGANWLRHSVGVGAWSGRSGHTTAAFKNNLWVIGGGVNDVWKSSDGRSWIQATGPGLTWSKRRNHAAASFAGSLWVLGGFDTSSNRFLNDVWRSSEGAIWTGITSKSAWNGREGHTAAAHQDKLWIMGGMAPIGYLNDVWWSVDGNTWTLATSNARWSPRTDHATVVFDNKIWILGGYSGIPNFYKNDVWCSEDGTTWLQISENAGWSPRKELAAAVYDNKMWIIGGYDGNNRNDVWCSTNGATWTQATPNANWTARTAHTAAAHRGRLWIMGGFTGSNYTNEVWWSTDGAKWTMAYVYTGWSKRAEHATVVFDDKMWVLGGMSQSGYMNDTWYWSGHEPPAITEQPKSLTVNPGESASFRVTAQGTAPLSYTWSKDGHVIPDATLSEYVIASALNAYEGVYACYVRNDVGSAASNPVSLAVNDPPLITAQPQSQTVRKGQTVKFNVTATGTNPFYYQWHKDGVSIWGATQSRYSLASALKSYEGAYSCYVWNTAGSEVSDRALLTVLEPPEITGQPQSQTVNPGQTVLFEVTASGISPIHFQWNKDGEDLPGATRHQYVIEAAMNAFEGAYVCYVSNIGGSTRSDTAFLDVNDPPEIILQPVSQTVTTGNSAAFAVMATGTEPLGYQWIKEENVIPGATAAGFTISNVQETDEGIYACRVSNMAGSATSNTATLSVMPPLQPPEADFIASPRIGVAPLSVLFTDLSDYKGREPVSREWTFGDGGTSNRRNPIHTYSSPGTYSVSLTIATHDGNDTEAKTNYIVASPQSPLVDFTGTPLWGPAPLLVQFTDATITYGQAELSRWWTFGDGGTSAMQNPSHIYRSPGQYSVSLTVTTGAGSDTLTKTHYITASDTGEGLTMWIPDRSALPGDDVVIPLNLSAPDGAVLRGVQIEFLYDETLLDASSLEVQSTALTGRMSFVANVSTPGKAIMTIMGQPTGEIRGVGHLFDVIGRIRDDAPENVCGAMEFDKVYLYDQNVNPLPVDFSDTGELCVTNQCLLGDLNGNGEVEIGDALYALQISIGERETDLCSVQSGDLNGDNVIDSADVVMLQRLATGLPINPSPAEKAHALDPMLLGVILEDTDFVTVSLGSAAALVGADVDVPILIDAPQGLSGFDMRVTYPPELSPLKQFAGSVLAGGQMDCKVEEGRINIGMGRATGIAPSKGGPGTLATLRFKVIAMPAGGKAELHIERCDLKGQYGDRFAWFTAVQKIDANIEVRETGEEPDTGGCIGSTLDGAPPPVSGTGGGPALAGLALMLAWLVFRRGNKTGARSITK